MNIFRFIKQGRALPLKLNSRSIFKTLKSGNYERNTLTSTALKVEITKFTGDLAQNRRVYIQWKLKACKIWKLFVEKNTEVWLPYWAGVRFLPYSAFCYLNNKSLYFYEITNPHLVPSTRFQPLTTNKTARSTVHWHAFRSQLTCRHSGNMTVVRYQLVQWNLWETTDI